MPCLARGLLKYRSFSPESGRCRGRLSLAILPATSLSCPSWLSSGLSLAWLKTSVRSVALAPFGVLWLLICFSSTHESSHRGHVFGEFQAPAHLSDVPQGLDAFRSFVANASAHSRDHVQWPKISATRLLIQTKEIHRGIGLQRMYCAHNQGIVAVASRDAMHEKTDALWVS